MAPMDGSIQIVKEHESKRSWTPLRSDWVVARQWSPTAFALSSCLNERCKKMVELTGIEPVTPCLQSRCSPS